MTETVNETTDTATDVAKPDESKLNAFAQSTLGFLRGVRDSYMSLYTNVKAATENREAAIQELRETSDDADLVKLRDKRDKLNAQLEKVVEEMNQVAAALAGDASMTPEEVDAAKGQLKEIRGQFTSALQLSKATGNDLTDYIDALPTLRGTGAKATGEPGTRKLRVSSVYVNDDIVDHPVKAKDGTETRKSGFSDAARVLTGMFDRKVTVTELHEAYFQTASSDVGKEITELADAPAIVEFVISHDDKSAKVRVVREDNQE